MPRTDVREELQSKTRHFKCRVLNLVSQNLYKFKNAALNGDNFKCRVFELSVPKIVQILKRGFSIEKVVHFLECSVFELSVPKIVLV